MTKYIIYICYFIDGDKMKRIILCIFCFLVIFIILFENYFTVSENNVVSEAERRSIFISYIEIGKYFEGEDKNGAYNNVLNIVKNITHSVSENDVEKLKSLSPFFNMLITCALILASSYPGTVYMEISAWRLLVSKASFPTMYAELPYVL